MPSQLHEMVINSTDLLDQNVNNMRIKQTMLG